MSEEPTGDSMPDLFTLNLAECSRCGGNHRDIEFKKFSKSPVAPRGTNLVYTHFAMCPNLNEPLLYHKKGATVVPPPKEKESLFRAASTLDLH